MSSQALLSAPRRYVPAARLLHWLVAVLVLVVWPVGFVIGFVKEEVKLTFYMVHESLGFIVLWLMLARLAVRLLNPPPPGPAMPAVPRILAAVVHTLLYVALLAQPVLGFLATNAFGFPLELFWAVPVWSPIGKSPDIAPFLGAAHYFLGWAILVLLLLHVCGVVYHQAIRRDELLQRMT